MLPYRKQNLTPFFSHWVRSAIDRTILVECAARPGTVNAKNSCCIFLFNPPPLPTTLPYPPECRKHYVHCLVMGLSRPAIADMDRGAYEKLRKMYNQLDIPGPDVPRPEEMEMAKLCKHPFCK